MPEELLDDVYEQEYLYLFPSTCVHHNKIIPLSAFNNILCVQLTSSPATVRENQLHMVQQKTFF